MVAAQFQEKRDFNVAVCMLKKVGFSINEESPVSGTLAASPHPSTLAYDFSGDAGPRLSSITPMPRFMSPPGIVHPPSLPSNSTLGDLCFTKPSIAAGNYGTSGPSLASQSRHPQAGLEQSSPYLQNTIATSSQMSYLNPYHVFAGRRNYENFIPKVSSPLRHRLHTGEPIPEELYPQLHPVLGRRASFSHHAASEGPMDDLDDPWNDGPRRQSSSQPGAQPSHYLSREASLEYIENVDPDLEQHSNSNTTFRELMPQARSLPFRPSPEIRIEEADSPRLALKRVDSTKPIGPPGHRNGGQNQTKSDFASTGVSSESKPSYLQEPREQVSAKPNKKKRPNDPRSPRQGNESSPTSTPKESKLRSSTISRKGTPESRVRPVPKPSKNSVKPAPKVTSTSIIKIATQPAKALEQPPKAKQPRIVTKDDSQQKIATTRRVTRKAFRDAGGTIDQLAHLENDRTLSSTQDNSQSSRMTTPPTDSSRELPQSTGEASVPPIVTRETSSEEKQELEAELREAVRGRTRSSARSQCSSHGKTASQKNPASRVRKPQKKGTRNRRNNDKRPTSHGKSRLKDILEGISTEPERPTDSETLLQSQSIAPRETSPVGRPQQHNQRNVGSVKQKADPIIFVTDEMLNEVNKTTSKILDQYEADLGRGCDEEEYAHFYCDRLLAARRNEWYSQLSKQGIYMI